MVSPIQILSNRVGIPRIASDSVVESASQVVFSTSTTREFVNNYNGLILLKLTQTLAAASDTLPIYISSASGAMQAITQLGGEPWTGADYATGIHLAYFESSSNTLQIIA